MNKKRLLISRKYFWLALALAAAVVLFTAVSSRLRSVEKAAIVIAANEGDTPNIRGIFVGSSNQKIQIVISTRSALSDRAVGDKVFVYIPNKDGNRENPINGYVSFIDEDLDLVLIALEKEVKTGRALKFSTETTATDEGARFLTSGGDPMLFSEYDAVLYNLEPSNLPTEGQGLLPILDKKEQVIAFYNIDTGKLLTGAEIINYLVSVGASISYTGQPMQGNVLSVVIGVNFLILYVLAMLVRNRRKKALK